MNWEIGVSGGPLWTGRTGGWAGTEAWTGQTGADWGGLERTGRTGADGADWGGGGRLGSSLEGRKGQTGDYSEAAIPLLGMPRGFQEC